MHTKSTKVPVYQSTLTPRDQPVIEIINPNIVRGRIRHTLFDFDGTLSLIREGWQDVMIPQMVEWLLETPDHESEAELTAVVKDYVTRLTGKQTVYQMIQLAEEISKRGGQPQDPLVYKHAYLARLWERIQDRVAGAEGRDDPARRHDGARRPGDAGGAALNAACDCYLASGTDEPYVLDEAAALRVTPYFAGIYGAQDDYKRFSKKLLIERIIAEQGLSGPEFVAFGDGFVEIEDTKLRRRHRRRRGDQRGRAGRHRRMEAHPPDPGRRGRDRAGFPGARGVGGVFVCRVERTP